MIVRKLALALAVAAVPVPAFALSHLVPEDSALALLVPKPYHFGSRTYLQSLAPVFDRSVRVFAVETGSPFPESIIGLKSNDGVLYIFGAQPSSPTSAPLPRAVPPPIKLLGTDGRLHSEPRPVTESSKPPTYQLHMCNASIDPKLAERIVRAWDGVLLETRPDAGEPHFGADGALFHFGSNTKYSVITGMAVGVDYGSRPSLLGLMSYDLNAICWKWKPPVKGALDPHVELEQTLRRLEGR